MLHNEGGCGDHRKQLRHVGAHVILEHSPIGVTGYGGAHELTEEAGLLTSPTQREGTYVLCPHLPVSLEKFRHCVPLRGFYALLSVGEGVRKDEVGDSLGMSCGVRDRGEPAMLCSCQDEPSATSCGYDCVDVA